MKKSYAWMMSSIQLLVLTIAFCGTTILTSCDNDDKYSSDNTIKSVRNHLTAFYRL